MHAYMSVAAVCLTAACGDESDRPSNVGLLPAVVGANDGMPGATMDGTQPGVIATMPGVEADMGIAGAGADDGSGSLPGDDMQPPATGDGTGTVSPDGDPNAAVVEIPGVACGSGGATFGIGATNFNIGGRDVQLNYGCNKRAGAEMTFILNLHGTMPSEDIKLYQVAYFAAHEYVDSHNLIVVAPKAVGSQWGRSDGGTDEPHLLEIVDWVYANFSAVNITSMWVAGHSWGAFYAKTFVCSGAIADKVGGVVAQAGGNNNPDCIDRISHIHTMGELDMGGVLPNQSGPAAAHGCDSQITGPEMLGNNRYRYHANCDVGWVHSDYLMLGKQHTDNIDAVVVENIISEIKGI